MRELKKADTNNRDQRPGQGLNLEYFCVEFHGDYWHANPELYEENEMISYPNSVAKKAGDIWVLDSTRADHIREKGFKLFVVWESEYKTDKIGTIKKLLQRIENEN